MNGITLALAHSGISQHFQDLHRAKDTYDAGKKTIASLEYVIGYAEDLYDIASDPEAWLLHLRVPPGLIAVWRLYVHLRTDVAALFEHDTGGLRRPHMWTAEKCETLAAVVLAAAHNTPSVPIPWRFSWKWRFYTWAEALVARGLSIETTGDYYTSSRLHTHHARLLYRQEWAKRKYHLPQDNAPSSVEDDAERAEQHLRWANGDAEFVLRAGEQSRCYRAIAIAYAERNHRAKAKQFFALMDLVEGITEVTGRKNFAARRSWGF
ncbi:MAG: hypothetical protein V4474_02510 [Patescibacteria group bacterium]